ncbi:alpha/beta hydrolase [Dyadobacter sp. NIV53]|uniref:alpha/beta hydrolase n=1 Tax=Dyadobacter sp. NIV53 TaxID=2861765 RepID=UPI001C883E0B|nr:alpha/beta hydrolase [Dyadobacter sp. NIV53]
MKSFCLFITLIFGSFVFCYGQITPTGIPDTTFTLISSFQHEQKNHPEIVISDSTMPTNVTAFRNVLYLTTPEKKLYLDVYRPAGKPEKVLTTVLMIHGGGWRSGNRSHNNTLARQLAARGFVAVTADYRLSTDALYPAAVNDLKTAVSWLRENAGKYGVDTNKIAVLGFSAGGQLAALIGTTNDNNIYKSAIRNHSSSVQAIVDIDGTLAFIHPESGEGDDSRSTSAATYWFGYPKNQKPELWHQAGALNHVSSQTPPILFLNSSVARMHAGRDDMIKKMNAFNIYTEVHSFPEAPHTFMFFDPWFKPTLNYIDDFLKRILL